ncbi:MAG: DNA translocase FtsK 4TM domain-containing protein [Deltaproteobacteria bacterium]|nr:DNA translocase FtsK 4TM domain-containing protein [Deltaproteobacteria bacterium]
MGQKEEEKSSHKPVPEGLNRGKEISGILILAICLFIAISLLSYSQNDPAFFTQGVNEKISNWGGIVGSYLAGGLFFLIGFSAYLLPVLLFTISMELLLRKDFPFKISIPISLFFLLISCSGFLSIFASDKFYAGGLVGGYVDYFLEDYLNTFGTIILLTAVMAITAVYGTGISVVDIAKKTYSGCKFIYEKASELWTGWRERQQELKDIEPEEKPDKPIIDKKPLPPKIVMPEPPPAQAKKAVKQKEIEPVQEHFEFLKPDDKFQLPPISLLDANPEKGKPVDEKGIIINSQIVEKKLLDFGVEGKVLAVRPGPVVTMYEFEPAPGIKVGKIVNLTDDLALALRASSIRILAPVPGKAVVGIEVPNAVKEKIFLRDIFESEEYAKSHSLLTLGIGKDLAGNTFVADLAKMPHLLLAGATGTGKSVSINAMILSILYKASPDDVRFIMIDPKMLELSAYESIPHLMTQVVTDPKKAAGILRGIVREMGERYKLMAEMGAKNIAQYNKSIDEGKKPIENANNENKNNDREHKRLPYIVVIIDELADLMMVAGKDVEDCLVRLSQMARAAGIHLLVATQRPSVDVITGLIKANFPARISCQVVSRTDSRTILDAMGAESLLGEGDMLFLPPSTAKLQRIHGGYISEIEINRVTEFLKKQGKPVFDKEIAEAKLEDKNSAENNEEDNEEFNRRYDEAVNIALQMGQISTSYIQRRLRIGYNTAARIIEKMEEEGVVGPSQGSRPREVLARREM